MSAEIIYLPSVQPDASEATIFEFKRPHPEGFFDPKLEVIYDSPIPTDTKEIFTTVGGASLTGVIESPATIHDTTPIVWGQGYLGAQLFYEPARHATTQYNRTSVSIGRAGRQTPLAMLSKNHFLKPHTVTQQSPGAILKELDADFVDIAAHSMGGPISMETALRHPDQVRTLVLLGSAGLTGHGIPDLASKMPSAVQEVRRNMSGLVEKFGAAGAMAIARYFYGNPIRPIAEAMYVARADIRAKIPIVRDLGVKVVVVAFAEDCFFDAKRMRDEVGDDVDLFIDLEADLAGHIAPLLQPNLVAAAVKTSIDHAQAVS